MSGESEPDEGAVDCMDEGDADTDVDPDEEMEFHFPGFTVIDKSTIEFSMNLIGRWIGYKFVNDAQVPFLMGGGGETVCKVANLKVDERKGFTHDLKFPKVTSFQHGANMA